MDIFSQYRGLKKEVYIVSLCKIIDRMGSLAGPMLTILLSVKLNLSATVIAKWMSIYSISSLPIHLLGGRLADKVNKKMLINICDISSTLIYIVCGLMKLNELTIALYLFGSLLQHAEQPAYHNLIADNTKSIDRERAHSLMYITGNLGSAVAPILGGILIDNHANLLFIISGIVQLISILIFNLNIKETRLYADKENKYEAISDKTSIFEILRDNKVVLFYALIATITAMIYHQFSYLIPIQLSSINAVSGPKLYGTMCSINCIVVLLFTSIITTILKKYGSLTKMMIGELFQMAGYIIIAYNAIHVFALYIGTIIFTFGEITETIASSPYYLNRIPANYRGRFESFHEVLRSVVSNTCLIFIGSLYDKSGIIATWNFIFVTIIIAIILYGILRKYDRKVYRDLYIRSNTI